MDVGQALAELAREYAEKHGRAGSVLASLEIQSRMADQGIPVTAPNLYRLQDMVDNLLTEVWEDYDRKRAPIPEHPWQEYNRVGNTCHYPGCQLAEDDHPKHLARNGES